MEHLVGGRGQGARGKEQGAGGKEQGVRGIITCRQETAYRVIAWKQLLKISLC